MMIKKYRKRPVVVEAVQFTEKNKYKIFNYITCNKSTDLDEDNCPIIKIQTLEGIMTAKIGDWIIKGINGEFYPCKPDIFEKTYEEV